MPTILIVHECAEERDSLVRILLGERFNVVTATDGVSGLKTFYEVRPDLVIMSDELASLPEEDLCARIRQANGVPIIVLGNMDDRVKWLALGADAYLMMPVSASVLIARVRSLLRRHKKHQDHNAKSSPTDLPSDLTSTENRLLFCLQSGQGKLFSYSQLLTGVWGGKGVSLDTLHYYVRRLQRKIGNSLIVQLRGIGYRFSGNGNGADSYTGGTKGGDNRQKVNYKNAGRVWGGSQ
jgi:DNA-binding response OmpR family regulator